MPDPFSASTPTTRNAFLLIWSRVPSGEDSRVELPRNISP